MRTTILSVALAAAAFAGCLSNDPSGAGSDAAQRGGGASSDTVALEAVTLVSHVAFGVFEMDVFVEKASRPGQVWRPTPTESAGALYRDAPLFATAGETPHDPTFSNAGPFAQGPSLGLTLAEWLAASGSVAYTCVGGAGGRGFVDGSFAGLVPGGLYTFWNARLVFTDGAITGGVELPAGAADGSESTFRADAEGNGRFAAQLLECDEPSTGGPGLGPTGEATVFAIAYHSDGSTYGDSPGPFGSKSHIHLFGMARTPYA